jgi:hypothetical protein
MTSRPPRARPADSDNLPQPVNPSMRTAPMPEALRSVPVDVIEVC